MESVNKTKIKKEKRHKVGNKEGRKKGRRNKKEILHVLGPVRAALCG